MRLQVIDYWIICAALTGAIVESHYLARGPLQFVTCARRGLVGAGFAKAGLGALVWRISKTLVFIVVAPLPVLAPCPLWSCWHGSSAGPRPGASIAFFAVASC